MSASANQLFFFHEFCLESSIFQVVEWQLFSLRLQFLLIPFQRFKAGQLILRILIFQIFNFCRSFGCLVIDIFDVYQLLDQAIPDTISAYGYYFINKLILNFLQQLGGIGGIFFVELDKLVEEDINPVEIRNNHEEGQGWFVLLMKLTNSAALAQVEPSLADVCICDSLLFYFCYLLENERQFHCIGGKGADQLELVGVFQVLFFLLLEFHGNCLGDNSWFGWLVFGEERWYFFHFRLRFQFWFDFG